MKDLALGPVNYISYGSNTNYDRFKLYIEGGQAPGSTSVQPGCTDKTLPPAGRPVVLDRELYFRTDPDPVPWWEGGVAFIGLEPDNSQPTLAVAYRLRPGQFEEVAAQEDGRGLQPEPIDLKPLREVGHACMFPGGVYGEVVYCGDDDEGIPFLSFTHGQPAQPDQYLEPKGAYLGTIAAGVMKAHGLDAQETAAYFAGKKGIKDKLPLADILRIIETKP